MAAIHLDQGVPKADPGKAGDYYDRCPYDGCLEVDRAFKDGGVDGRGEEHLAYSIYNADPRQGGCGSSWSRTTREGLDTVHRDGSQPHWLTRSAERGAVSSLPSARYRDRYGAIDWTK